MQLTFCCWGNHSAWKCLRCFEKTKTKQSICSTSLVELGPSRPHGLLEFAQIHLGSKKFGPIFLINFHSLRKKEKIKKNKKIGRPHMQPLLFLDYSNHHINLINWLSFSGWALNANSIIYWLSWLSFKWFVPYKKLNNLIKFSFQWVGPECQHYNLLNILIVI